MADKEMRMEDRDNDTIGEEEDVEAGLLDGNVQDEDDGTMYKPRDFGYIYRSSENRQGEDADLDDEEEEEDILKPFEKVNHSYSPEDDTEEAPYQALFLCSCCCIISILILVLGAFLFDSDELEGDSGARIAGAVILALGVVFFGVAIILCCSSCIFICIKGPRNLGKSSTKEWSIKRLNDKYYHEINLYDSLRYNVGSNSKSFKEKRKEEKKIKADKRKQRDEEIENLIKHDLESGLSTKAIQNRRRPTVFKIVFDGDVMVSTIDVLREQITLAIKMGNKRDTVAVIVSSGGGAVSMYGLAAQQLYRVRKSGMKLVVCVDSIAASGGYMMAVTASPDCLYCSSMALIGSIGVITIVPNVQKLLEKHDVNTYVFTAGKYKRTVDVIGEVTEDGKKKLLEELEQIHQVFKDHIVAMRPALAKTIDEVSTGEAWLAVEGKKKGLADEIKTSDEFFMEAEATHDIVEIKPKPKRHPYLDDIVDLSAQIFHKLTPFKLFAQQQHPTNTPIT